MEYGVHDGPLYGVAVVSTEYPGSKSLCSAWIGWRTQEKKRTGKGENSTITRRCMHPYMPVRNIDFD